MLHDLLMRKALEMRGHAQCFFPAGVAPGNLPDTALCCHCGNLLARLVAEGVELKCSRYKRRVIVSLQGKVGERIAI
jgi:hypothetical protein